MVHDIDGLLPETSPAFAHWCFPQVPLTYTLFFRGPGKYRAQTRSAPSQLTLHLQHPASRGQKSSPRFSQVCREPRIRIQTRHVITNVGLSDNMPCTPCDAGQLLAESVPVGHQDLRLRCNEALIAYCWQGKSSACRRYVLHD